MVDKEKYERLKHAFANQLPKDLTPPREVKNVDELLKEIIVLWRISLPYTIKTDYSRIVPYAVKEIYNIEPEQIIKRLMDRELVFVDKEGDLSVSPNAQPLLDYYNCITIMAMHPEYELTYEMFESDPRWHIAPDSDIIWWNFNARIADYEYNHKWEKLRRNYINQAHLLFEEQKYKKSLEYFTVAAFLSTTGIKDDDIVSVYEENNGFMYCRDLVLVPEDTTKYLRRMKRENITTIDEIKEVFYNNQFIKHYLNILPFYYLDIDNGWAMLEEALTYKRNICFGMGEMLVLRIRLKYNIPDSNSKHYFYNSLENQRKYHRYPKYDI